MARISSPSPPPPCSAVGGSRLSTLLLAASVAVCWLLLLTHDEGSWRATLAGKRVVICGASQGIGEQLAYVYCEAGASVLLVSRSQSRLNSVASECRRRRRHQGHVATATDNEEQWTSGTFAGDRGMFVTEPSSLGNERVVTATLSMDLSGDELDASNVIAYATMVLGNVGKVPAGLDTLVLNHIVSSGGYDSRGWLATANMTQLRQTLEVNTLSYIALATAALPALQSAAGSGTSGETPTVDLCIPDRACLQFLI